MAASEIREYEHRVRFKAHVKQCQQLEASKDSPSPTRQNEQVIDITTSDSDQTSNSDIIFDHGSPDLIPVDHHNSNANGAVRPEQRLPRRNESEDLG